MKKEKGRRQFLQNGLAGGLAVAVAPVMSVEVNLYCTGKTAEQVCWVLFAELKAGALKLVSRMLPAHL